MVGIKKGVESDENNKNWKRCLGLYGIYMLINYREWVDEHRATGYTIKEY